jgi:hypothetical protein
VVEALKAVRFVEFGVADGVRDQRQRSAALPSYIRHHVFLNVFGAVAAPEEFTIGNEKWKIVAKLLIFGLFSTFWQRKSKYRNQNVTTPFSHPEKDFKPLNHSKNSENCLNTVSKCFIYFFFTAKTAKNGHFRLSGIVGNCRKLSGKTDKHCLYNQTTENYFKRRIRLWQFLNPTYQENISHCRSITVNNSWLCCRK